MILCASPAYLERHGAPGSPQELAAHQWLAFGRETRDETATDGFAASAAVASPHPATMPLELHAAGGGRERLEVEARIASNNQMSLQQMCEHGLGIARLGHADVLPRLRSGALVRVLPGWRFATLPVWAVTPRREGEAAKVRVAIEHLKRYFATLPTRPAA
jgi:DNA-binding transcriptional LysR family regulator